MKYAITPLAFALGSSALAIRQNQQCVQLQAKGGASGTLGQLSDGQNRIGGDHGAACYCLDENGGFTDSQGRGCILTPPTTQFQCDVGASPTNGFAINGGSVTYNGNAKFYACPVNDNGEYNVYTQPAPGQDKCVEITLGPGPSCSGGNQPSASSSKPAPSQPAQSAPAPPPKESQTGYPVPPKESQSPPPQPPKESQPAQPPKESQPPAPQPPKESQAPPPQPPKESQPAQPPKESQAPPPPPPKESYPAQPPKESQPPAPQPPKESQAPPPQPPKESQPAQPPKESQAPPPPPPKESYPAQPPKESQPPAPQPPKESQAPPPQPPKESYPAQPPKESQPLKPSQPAPSQPAQSPAPPAPTQPGNNGNGNGCPADLNGEYQYPHLIVPVSSSKPSNAPGTSYNGKANGDVCSLFNFDIPQSYSGHTCTLVFLFPEQKDLETSSFTISGSGGLEFSQCDTNASQKTTFDNKGTCKAVKTVDNVAPGNSYTIVSDSCAAGKTVTYQMCATGSLSLDYFQDYNPSPIGAYVREC